jgi:signal transduction histidine kinase
VEGRVLAVAGRPIHDASGRSVGTLAIVADRTRETSEFNLWVAIAILLSLTAASVVFISFDKALAGVDAEYRRRHELELRLMRMSGEHQRRVQIEKLSAMGVMIGEIAHQLNNPLVGVINMAQLAQRSVDQPDRVRALLGEILAAGRSCSHFVKRTLHFAKASRYEQRLCDLREAVDEACMMFRQSVGRRTTLDLRLPSDPANIMGDATLLANALFNLLANAAQAMGQDGRAAVTLAAQTDADGRAGWRLSVEDEGPGVAEADLPKLFTPFFTTRRDGTGLGLAVALHIALLHEGRLVAANRPGGGAIFTLWTPAATNDLATAA